MFIRNFEIFIPGIRTFLGAIIREKSRNILYFFRGMRYLDKKNSCVLLVLTKSKRYNENNFNYSVSNGCKFCIENKGFGECFAICNGFSPMFMAQVQSKSCSGHYQLLIWHSIEGHVYVSQLLTYVSS